MQNPLTQAIITIYTPSTPVVSTVALAPNEQRYIAQNKR